MKERQLYKVVTKGCGTFYVIADGFDKAAESVGNELKEQEYGYSGDRAVTYVMLLSREEFVHGRRILGGEMNKLIITE